MYSHHRNFGQGHYGRGHDSQVSYGLDKDGISDDGSLGVSEGDVIDGFWFQNTRHSSYLNRGVYYCGDLSGDNRRGGFRSQNTIHSYFLNHGASVDCDGRGVYRYQTSHSTYHNCDRHGRLSDLSVASW